jgi:D-isomer specific 2-hydroxyacid dehydrogenase-like protein
VRGHALRDLDKVATLLDALRRDHLCGAALDVHVGEFERPPMAQLWSDRRVLITPHVSNGSDENRHGGVDVFCDNLRAYRDGRPLRNVIDLKTAAHSLASRININKRVSRQKPGKFQAGIDHLSPASGCFRAHFSR